MAADFKEVSGPVHLRALESAVVGAKGRRVRRWSGLSKTHRRSRCRAQEEHNENERSQCSGFDFFSGHPTLFF